ncbi:hypothetical protein CDL15_Pgr007743 [Punica granatum]|uniref:Uncharacterized protein n=1 Tax=Punica granatum TaxID=22663 RepID=A0A218X911_PUNGR|nr:hypothetical protein CDL15_Pgr007743 [Punica granatum]
MAKAIATVGMPKPHIHPHIHLYPNQDRGGGNGANVNCDLKPDEGGAPLLPLSLVGLVELVRPKDETQGLVPPPASATIYRAT